jgi:hypothetical protein
MSSIELSTSYTQTRPSAGRPFLCGEVHKNKLTYSSSSIKTYRGISLSKEC